MTRKKRVIAIFTSVILVLAAVVIISNAVKPKPITYTYNPRHYKGVSTASYDDYINGVINNLTKPSGVSEEISGINYSTNTGEVAIVDESTLNNSGTSVTTNTHLLKTSENSKVSWNVNMPRAGFYRIVIGYYTIKEVVPENTVTNNPIVRTIDVETNSSKANSFYGETIKDNRFNINRTYGKEEITNPTDNTKKIEVDVEIPYYKVSQFGTDIAYDYYLSEGQNKITLNAIKGDLAIDFIKVISIGENDQPGPYTGDNEKFTTYAKGILENVIPTLYNNKGEAPIRINATSNYTAEGHAEVVEASSLKNEAGNETAVNNQLLFVSDRANVSWTVSVPQAGFYTIYIRYFTTKENSTRSSIVRRLDITTPHSDINDTFKNTLASESFSFSRNWGAKDNTAILSSDSTDNNKHVILDTKRDLNDNDVKPSQIEKPTYMESYFEDDMGYTIMPYEFYFAAGANTIKLNTIKEWFMIDYLEIAPIKDETSYQVYKQENEGKVDNAPSDFVYKMEAETALVTSSPMLYPTTDRTSSKTYPNSPKSTRLNIIGGDSWKILGDWIMWEFEVPADGYYKISMRARQNLVRGLYSSRIIYVDDQILFSELRKSIFSYSATWQMLTLGSEEEEYEFYLTAGRHTISMEVTLGEYAPLVEYLESVIDDLSNLYLDIIKYTTTAPDAGRDYQLDTKTDLQLLERLKTAREQLQYITDSIAEISGSKSDKTGNIDNIIDQIEGFIKNHRTLPGRLTSFSTNISSLGTLMTELREYPLAIDYLVVYPAKSDYKLEKPNENFLRKFWDGIVSFYYSFIVDYSAIGSSIDEGDTGHEIDVWMTLGRDQANVLRKIIDQEFTPQTGIKVNLRLTGADVLLKAALAGVGPDVAINVDSSLPVNYGLRGAVADLLGTFGENSAMAQKYHNDPKFISFESFIKDNFHESATNQFSFNGESFALPEKQIYMTMFVNTKVMSKTFGSNWEERVPDTWEDAVDLVSDLQASSLQFWLPVNDAGANALSPVFVSMLYQNGGDLYINDNRQTGLLTPVSMDTFEYWTNLYTLYSFPKYASFLNRFRSGEMPIGLSYYELYNTLSVFAPEMRGNWAFYPIPGTEQTIDYIDPMTMQQVLDQSGNPQQITYIDHTSTAVGTGAVILQKTVETDEQRAYNAWQFLTWWTGTSAQTSFGLEMEGILGSAARHATANFNAFQQLAWPQNDLDILLKQWGIVQESDAATQDYLVINGKLRPCFVDKDGTIHVYGVHEMPQIAGSYITGREVENAYRTVINNNYNAKETLYEYAQNIQNEIDRKRKEFGLPIYGED